MCNCFLNDKPKIASHFEGNKIDIVCYFMQSYFNN